MALESRVILPAALLLLVPLALLTALAPLLSTAAALPKPTDPEDDEATAAAEVSDAELWLEVAQQDDDIVAAAATPFADEVPEVELLPKLYPPLLRAATLSRRPAEKANKHNALLKIMFGSRK